MRNANRWVVAWLILVCLLIFSTVVVGGLTRLTQSGLSMVEWQPIHGVVPPISQAEWLEEFALYKQTPEYQKINQGMSLEDFKYIFYWEYFHRLLGRLIGLVYFIPLLIFQYSGVLKSLSLHFYKSSKRLSLKLWIGLILGGSQGLLGWYMVKSGLIDNPHVSHYRLAAHLGLAFFIVAFLAWIAMDLVRGTKILKIRSMIEASVFAKVLLVLVSVQIVYGAFTAGLHAGLNYNTFPTMKGQLIPEGLLAAVPLWTNFFESHLTVQFIHRSLAWVLLFVMASFLVFLKSKFLNPSQKRAVTLVSGVLVVQFLLGVFTLLNYVPLSLASLHQLGAFALFMSILYLNHSFKKTHG